MRVQYRVSYKTPRTEQGLFANVLLDGPPELAEANPSGVDMDAELTALVEGARKAIERHLGGEGVVDVSPRPGWDESWRPEYVYAKGQLDLLTVDLPNRADFPKMIAEVIRAVKDAGFDSSVQSNRFSISHLRVPPWEMRIVGNVQDASDDRKNKVGVSLSMQWVQKGRSAWSDWCLSLRVRCSYDIARVDRWITFDEANIDNILYATVREAIDAVVQQSPASADDALSPRARCCTHRNHTNPNNAPLDLPEWMPPVIPRDTAMCNVKTQDNAKTTNAGNTHSAEFVLRNAHGEVVGYAYRLPPIQLPNIPHFPHFPTLPNGLYIPLDSDAVEISSSPTNPTAPSLCQAAPNTYATDPKPLPEWIQNVRLPTDPALRDATIKTAWMCRYWLKDALDAYRELLVSNNLMPEPIMAIGLTLAPRHTEDSDRSWERLVLWAIHKQANRFSKDRLMFYLVQKGVFNDLPPGLWELDGEGLLEARSTTELDWESAE